MQKSVDKKIHDECLKIHCELIVLFFCGLEVYENFPALFGDREREHVRRLVLAAVGPIEAVGEGIIRKNKGEFVAFA